MTEFGRFFNLLDENKKASSLKAEAQSADILIPDAGVLMVKAGRSLALRQLFDRLNHDELTHRAAIHKLDFAGDLGEQSVIFAPADI